MCFSQSQATAKYLHTRFLQMLHVRHSEGRGREEGRWAGKSSALSWLGAWKRTSGWALPHVAKYGRDQLYPYDGYVPPIPPVPLSLPPPVSSGLPFLAASTANPISISWFSLVYLGYINSRLFLFLIHTFCCFLTQRQF